MILDAQTLLSDAQAVTADAVSTNTIDLGDVTPKRDIGDGEPLALVVTVDVAADSTTGDETYSFEFIQSANANLGSADVLAARTVAAADLYAGAQVVIPIPPGAITKRYIGLNYNVGGTTPTITCTSYVVPQSFVPKLKNYADGFTIS